MAKRISKRFTLNRQDVKDITRNLKLFLAPLATMYLISVVAAMQANENLFRVDYLVPNTMVQGAMVLYVLNFFLDAIKKFVDDNKK